VLKRSMGLGGCLEIAALGSRWRCSMDSSNFAYGALEVVCVEFATGHSSEMFSEKEIEAISLQTSSISERRERGLFAPRSVSRQFQVCQ
jgi:hypothetical protein